VAVEQQTENHVSANNGNNNNNAILSSDQREKMMRLEIENQRLREQLLQYETTTTTPATNSKADGSTATGSNNSESTPFAVAVPAAADTVLIDGLKAEIQRLTEAYQTKEQENLKIASDKDKLEAYTKRTLAKFQDKYLVALQECKAKLKEKQDKIELLEKRSQTERNVQKREERLLSSAIYELGLGIMQNKLKSTTTSSSSTTTTTT
jgi:protein HOOK3